MIDRSGAYVVRLIMLLKRGVGDGGREPKSTTTGLNPRFPNQLFTDISQMAIYTAQSSTRFLEEKRPVRFQVTHLYFTVSTGYVDSCCANKYWSKDGNNSWESPCEFCLLNKLSLNLNYTCLDLTVISWVWKNAQDRLSFPSGRSAVYSRKMKIFLITVTIILGLLDSWRNLQSIPCSISRRFESNFICQMILVCSGALKSPRDWLWPGGWKPSTTSLPLTSSSRSLSARTVLRSSTT